MPLQLSVPNGQRFSKRFLAGVEVWVKQMMKGEKIVLTQPIINSHRSVPPKTSTPSKVFY
jgi:hypothetical protein